MTVAALVFKEEAGQVFPIESAGRSCADSPAVQALNQIERDIWIRYSRGDRQRDIAHDLRLDRSTVTKMISAVRDKVQFLVRLREILVLRGPELQHFLGCRDRCPCPLRCALRRKK